MNRRRVLTGLMAAPAVILTPGLLMPVKPIPTPFPYAVKVLTPNEMLVRFVDPAGKVLREQVADALRPLRAIFTATEDQIVRAEIVYSNGLVVPVDYGRLHSLNQNDSLTIDYSDYPHLLEA